MALKTKPKIMKKIVLISLIFITLASCKKKEIKDCYQISNPINLEYQSGKNRLDSLRNLNLISEGGYNYELNQLQERTILTDEYLECN